MLPVRDEQDYQTAGRMLSTGRLRTYTARAAARTWAGGGPTSGPTREAVMDDILAGGAAAALVVGMGDWWHGDDSSSDDNERALRGTPDRRGGPDDAPRGGADGLPNIGPGSWGTGKTAAGRIALASTGRGPARDREPWHGSIGGRACTCAERAANSTFDLSQGHRVARERERLLIDALRLTACARAALAAEQIRARRWAILVSVKRGGREVGLLARTKWTVATWQQATPVPDGFRAWRERSTLGADYLCRSGEPLLDTLLLCGLCGGEASGDVDQWASAHPLAGLVHGG